MANTAELEKKYIYKISRSGTFLGNLPNVKSEFALQQDINSAGAALVIEVADTPDHQFDAPEPILTEDGLPITDEFGATLTTERQPDIVGNANSKALIRNNNTIAVYEYSATYPNGLLVFNGWISRWKASFGGSDTIIINCLSNGSELDNYIISAQAADQVQAVQNSTLLINSAATTPYGGGQIINPGAGITNISKVRLKLASIINNSPVATVKIYSSSPSPIINLSRANSGATPDATKSLAITSTSPTDYDFGLNVAITNAYVIVVVCTDVNGVNLYYQNTDVYPSYSGLGISGDLYFSTYYTLATTNATYSSQDPTAILRDIIDGYTARGGTINYSTTSTVLTGTSRSYTFKVNTVLEGIKKAAELAPYDWYWYVDPATDTIYFKEASTTAEHYMVYGRHIQSLDVEASVEDVKNQVYFTGGDTGGNVYLYQTQSSPTGLAANANRVGLERLNDNRVTLSDTATALMTNFLNDNLNESYHTSIVVNAATYDISTLNLGQVVGFKGFGNFVDNLLLQIIHKELRPDYVLLTLGVIPKRQSAQVEEINRSLNDVETIYNPTTPS